LGFKLKFLLKLENILILIVFLKLKVLAFFKI
jgi:hypothetical protein